MTLEEKWEWDAWHMGHDRDWRATYRAIRLDLRRRALLSSPMLSRFRVGFRLGMIDAKVPNIRLPNVRPSLMTPLAGR